MKKKFLMLVTGQIVFVHAINEKTKQVHGWNIHSPNLRMKNYQADQFRGQDLPSKEQIQSNVKPAEFYNLENDNRHHNAETTWARYNTVLATIAGVVSKEVPVIAE